MDQQTNSRTKRMDQRTNQRTKRNHSMDHKEWTDGPNGVCADGTLKTGGEERRRVAGVAPQTREGRRRIRRNLHEGGERRLHAAAIESRM